MYSLSILGLGLDIQDLSMSYLLTIHILTKKMEKKWMNAEQINT